MRKSKIFDCEIVNLPVIKTVNGDIVSINNFKEIPFEVRRTYYLYDVPNSADRGGHAHKNLYQLIIAISGSFEIKLIDGENKKKYVLNQHNVGLLIVPGIWRELNSFSGGCLCLVLASDYYFETDYIRDYEDFINYKKE